KREPANARVILKLQSLNEELQNPEVLDQKLLSYTRNILLISSMQIVKEKTAKTILSFPQPEKLQSEQTQVFSPTPQDESPKQSKFNKKLSFLKIALGPEEIKGDIGLHGSFEFFTVNDPYRGTDPRFNPTFNNIFKIEGDLKGQEMYRWKGELLTLALPWWFAIGDKNYPLACINPTGTLIKEERDTIRNFGDQRVLNYGLTCRFLPEHAKNIRLEASASTSAYTAGYMIQGDESLITQEWKDYYLAQKGAPPKGNLMKNGADFDDSISLEAKCQIKGDINQPGDLMFECGGFYTKRKLQFDHDNNIQISPYRDQVDSATQSGLYLTLQMGLSDRESRHKKETEGWATSLVGTFQIENDELPSELMTLFNPQEAKKMDERQATLSLYLKFDF
ncbi:MAG: hypothetical protein HYY62_08115, partial [Deltaproteobacteria bacterium]|nr:hypothetical protein [Deltaproteobacteria bacterium]